MQVLQSLAVLTLLGLVFAQEADFTFEDMDILEDPDTILRLDEADIAEAAALKHEKNPVDLKKLEADEDLVDFRRLVLDAPDLEAGKVTVNSAALQLSETFVKDFSKKGRPTKVRVRQVLGSNGSASLSVTGSFNTSIQVTATGNGDFSGNSTIDVKGGNRTHAHSEGSLTVQYRATTKVDRHGARSDVSGSVSVKANGGSATTAFQAETRTEGSARGQRQETDSLTNTTVTGQSGHLLGISKARFDSRLVFHVNGTSLVRSSGGAGSGSLSRQGSNKNGVKVDALTWVSVRSKSKAGITLVVYTKARAMYIGGYRTKDSAGVYAGGAISLKKTTVSAATGNGLNETQITEEIARLDLSEYISDLLQGMNKIQ